MPKRHRWFFTASRAAALCAERKRCPTRLNSKSKKVWHCTVLASIVEILRFLLTQVSRILLEPVLPVRQQTPGFMLYEVQAHLISNMLTKKFQQAASIGTFGDQLSHTASMANMPLRDRATHAAYDSPAVCCKLCMMRDDDSSSSAATARFLTPLPPHMY